MTTRIGKFRSTKIENQEPTIAFAVVGFFDGLDIQESLKPAEPFKPSATFKPNNS